GVLQVRIVHRSVRIKRLFGQNRRPIVPHPCERRTPSAAPDPPPNRKSTMASSRASFHWDDPLLLTEQLTDDERMVVDSSRAYCQDKLKPRVLEAFRHEKMDASIFAEMGA